MMHDRDHWVDGSSLPLLAMRKTILACPIFFGSSVVSTCAQVPLEVTSQQVKQSVILTFSFGFLGWQYPSPLLSQMHPKPWFPPPIRPELVVFGREVLGALQHERRLELPDGQRY